ncbi:hypothetical protein [Novosphingobium sp.]|uniref:hypothetical protein n=1 Tax=Novosphingobium sp. TaxID=1874826 RepID=UPI0022C01B15|nr:hypothetical protein [Novosphingobium sp.]MCZ8019655.1 hypothetical protein [Novosphingobium sp.]MCZ8035470.1 hypothetical protein [Novosphingobium sp.]MCZ8050784.1 hypothetical protein [Novosphingobium sp.]MCZ8059130.1 hypothetical protein [Novosphingobium sp.]MCZ8232576.1 hypothetical protein [Novosphingobium sp.]
MTSAGWRVPARDAAFWPWAALIAVALFTLATLFQRSINWDEYWFLSQVHELDQQRLSRPLQTVHTRLFGWLLALPGNEIAALMAGRLFMFGCLLVAATAVAGLARRFAGREAALFAALAYLSTGFVFQHGYSFRIDPLATALLMTSLWALTVCRLTPLAIAGIGLVTGLAGMVTIKTVLYAPAFAGIAWLRWSEAGRSRAATLRLGAVALASLAWFAAIYLYHAHDLARTREGAAGTVLRTAFDHMFALFPANQWPMIRKGIATAPLQFLLILAVPVWLLRHRATPAEKIALLGLLGPLAALFYYQNTAAYFFTFMLAPVMVCAAIVLPVALARYGARNLAMLLAITPVVVWLFEPPSTLPAQRTIAAAADQLFPRPIGYFDKMGMLPRLAKENTFMTNWGVELYQRREVSGLAETMARTPVPLVLENDAIFTSALRGKADDPQVYRPEDIAALRGGYVNFWGPFWLAGRDVPAGAEPLRIELPAPGPYTVSGAPLVIDGVRHGPGAVVELARGSHLIAGNRAAAARLVWGNNLRQPDFAPPPQPWFVGF